MSDTEQRDVALDIAQNVAQRVAELPDRSSPGGWPEAMLVTGDELQFIVADEVREHVARLRQGGGVPELPEEPVRQRLDRSEDKFGACEECDARRNLGKAEDGAMICGSCADARYLGEMRGYAQELRALLLAAPQPPGGEGEVFQRPEEWRRASGGPRLDGPMVHDLKCAAGYFEEVLLGHETAELRVADRDFRMLDILRLHELEYGKLTGRTLERRITHIVWDSNGPWLAPGYCMLSLEAVSPPLSAAPQREDSIQATLPVQAAIASAVNGPVCQWQTMKTAPRGEDVILAVMSVHGDPYVTLGMLVFETDPDGDDDLDGKSGEWRWSVGEDWQDETDYAGEGRLLGWIPCPLFDNTVPLPPPPDDRTDTSGALDTCLKQTLPPSPPNKD
jgi:hypothetical protein